MFRFLVIVSLFLMASVSVFVHAQECEDDAAATQLIQQAQDTFWRETDFCQHTVDYSEFRSGGPGPDAIHRIDPEEVQRYSIDEAEGWLQPQSPVIAVEINGEARAYPLLMLTRHEIANDVLGETPIAVTFCPLCNSAIVFDRRVIEGEAPYTFGVSGLLRNSDMVMFDDQTKSWWQQFTGEGVVGEHAGDQLVVLPSLVVGFGQFAEQYPEGDVLAPESGFGRYSGNPYVDYDSSERPFLFSGEVDPRLPALNRVLAGVIAGEPIAYPFAILETEQVINDSVGGRDVVAFWQPGVVSALDRADIDASRDVGMAALYRREVDEQVLTFMLDEDGTITDAQTGSTWNVFGTAIAGELEGTQLRQELAAPHFWFAWAAFRPETALYSAAN